MPGDRNDRWYPSRRQTEFDWWATRAMRYLVGPGLMLWELFVDNARHLTVLLVGAMLSSSMDVLALVRGMVAAARQERQQLDELLREEMEREKRDDT